MLDASASPSSDATAQGTVVAVSSPIKKLLNMAELVARSSAAVLIVGETGTGKEIVAAHVYRNSLRATKPLIAINCAAIPENLVESELFGYEKGAFSGADSPKPGMFELADNGTVFLDEIGELDLKVQAKLLRILDGAPYYRLGGHKKILTNARIIAATNRDLDQAVEKGSFRADLYHRIAQFQLRVPPLRERPDDILPLANYFLAQAGVTNTRFSTEALDLMKAYEWPGNARELRNVVMQASVIAHEGDILPEHLSIQTKKEKAAAAAVAAVEGTLDDAERATIRRALESSSGNHTKAAKLLGISRRTLLRKLKAYREEGSPMASFLGRLSPQQHKSYRCVADIPGDIRTKDQTFPVHIANISLGGIGIKGVANAFEMSGELGINFQLPAGTVSAVGRMQWADPQGTVGIRFTSMSDEARGVLQQWLRQRQMEEGWALLQTPDPNAIARDVDR
jgi:transcriptional regulator with GAF, ATPase, and Fis domain